MTGLLVSAQASHGAISDRQTDS